MASHELINNNKVNLHVLPKFLISKGNNLKVALLIAGRSETSAYLIQELKQIDWIDLLVIRTKQITAESLKAKCLRYKLHLSMLFRRMLSTRAHMRLIDTQTELGNQYFIELSDPNLLTVLGQFEPDILAISGTKKVPDCVLSCASVALNLHHGTLPHYRGGSSVDWTTLENNYNHYGVTVHIATSVIDGGPIVGASRVIPFLFESFFMFRRRLYLTGAALLVDTIKHIDECTSIAIKNPKSTRIFRHTQKSHDHLDRVKDAFKSLELRRYIFLQRYRHVIRDKNSISFPKRVVASYITRSIRRQSLANGLYILNYHAICPSKSVTILEQLKAPSIFTTEDRFLTHLNYFKDHFRCVSLSEGLQLWQQGAAEREPVVALTFDDGLVSSTKYLEQMADIGLVPTFFVCGDPMCNRTPLEVHKLLLAALYLDYSNTKQTENFTKLFFSAFNSINPVSDAISVFLEHQYLTIEHTFELLQRGLIEALGSHTETHQSLAELDPASQLREINTNHSKLTDVFGEHLKYFSFPFGKLDRHDLVCDYLTESLGSDSFTCNGGINKTPDIPGSILRIAISNQNNNQLDRYLKLQWIR